MSSASSNNLISIRVEGMCCEGCAINIERALRMEKGVENVKADYKRGIVHVKLDPAKTNLERVISVIKRLGYEVD